MPREQQYDPLSGLSDVHLVTIPAGASVDGQSLIQADGNESQRDLLRQAPDISDTESSHEARKSQAARKPSSPSALLQLFLDLLLAVPPLCFLVYAIMVSRHSGESIFQEPVPSLIAASRYSPTIFPIAFAAAVANLLKAAAAWKLERGISVLSLEFLLNSRTVFSAVASPIALRVANGLTPALIMLWMLSPLGGQAALRVVSVGPSTASEPWSSEFLEFNGRFTHGGPGSSAGPDILPAIVGAFTAALSSPKDVKEASQDAFGNIKIPMVEPYLETGTPSEDGGWYTLDNRSDIVWSSLAGLPMLRPNDSGLRVNLSFTMETAYMYASCKVTHSTKMMVGQWYQFLRKRAAIDPNGFHHDQTLAIYGNGMHSWFSEAPREFVFTSFTFDAVTNATCELTTSFIEVDVKCHHVDCGAVRVRPLSRPKNITVLTALDGLGPTEQVSIGLAQQDHDFFRTFINASHTPWDETWITDPYSTPIQLYFTHPDTPYSSTYQNGFHGQDIWPVGDAVFSKRLTQLLNTFWIVSIAPFAALGNVSFSDPEDLGKTSILPFSRAVDGTLTPDVPVMRVDKIWLAVVFLASLVMLLAALLAAALGPLRRGPEILDHVSFLVRDNPHVNATQINSSMEDGPDQIRRLRDVRVCLGDIRSEDEKGYIAFATVGEAVPLAKQERGRLYG
ncbi:Fc.00g028140.m01.CDS01 [Cosmosporella sp. VM-42]